jgi:hypothetical protein
LQNHKTTVLQFTADYFAYRKIPHAHILRKLEAKNRRELPADLATGRLKNRGRRASENLKNVLTGTLKQPPD